MSSQFYSTFVYPAIIEGTKVFEKIFDEKVHMSSLQFFSVRIQVQQPQNVTNSQKVAFVGLPLCIKVHSTRNKSSLIRFLQL